MGWQSWSRALPCDRRARVRSVDLPLDVPGRGPRRCGHGGSEGDGTIQHRWVGRAGHGRCRAIGGPVFAPSICHWTSPVGVPDDAVTAAVKVTEPFSTDGLAELVTVVAV